MPVFLPPTQSEKASLMDAPTSATSSPFVPARPAPIVLPMPEPIVVAPSPVKSDSEPTPAEPIPSEPMA